MWYVLCLPSSEILRKSLGGWCYSWLVGYRYVRQENNVEDFLSSCFYSRADDRARKQTTTAATAAAVAAAEGIRHYY